MPPLAPWLEAQGSCLHHTIALLKSPSTFQDKRGIRLGCHLQCVKDWLQRLCQVNRARLWGHGCAAWDQLGSLCCKGTGPGGGVGGWGWGRLTQIRVFLPLGRHWQLVIDSAGASGFHPMWLCSPKSLHRNGTCNSQTRSLDQLQGHWVSLCLQGCHRSQSPAWEGLIGQLSLELAGSSPSF